MLTFNFYQSVIRLMVVLSLCLASSIQAQNLYDTSRIQEIKLYFSQPNWDYLLDTAASGSESYIFCRRAVINGVVFDSVGAKYKGNSSFSATRVKNPWHIELDHYKDLNYGGIKDIKLSNIFADPSQIREALSYEILQKYMNVPRANFAKVWVNDTLIGLYTNTEAITKAFCKREFQSVSSNNAFFKCTPPIPVVGGVRQSPNLSYLGADSSLYFLPYEKKSNYGWQDLVRLTDTIKNNFANIENTMDIDRAIWMLAFNNVFVNLDSYTGSISHNYYLWKDDNQRWNPIVWDINMSFAAFRILLVNGSNPSIDTASAITMSPFLHQNVASRPLIQGILNNPQYRRMYIAHMRTMLNENFRNNAYKLSALRWQNQIDAAVQEDPNKFTTYPQFKTNLRYAVPATLTGASGIFTLMDRRSAFIMDSVAEFRIIPPSISTPTHLPAAPRLNDSIWITTTINFNGTGTRYVYLGYRTATSQRFTKALMYDDGLHRDGAANDGVWGAGIKATSALVEYYVYADNAQAGMFSPQRAEHEFHNIKVGVSTAFVNGSVVINEVMANNTRTVQNPKGDYADWVELHNLTTQSVSLANAYLSDDAGFRTKWKFPATMTVPANGYLIVWCDDDSTNTTDNRPHTNFKLSNSGEKVFLTNSALQLVDSVDFGAQRKDTSWARLPNGTGVFRYLLPTFNRSNATTSTDDVAALNAIWVYPNPADKTVMIEKNNLNQSNSLEKVLVYDNVGRLVQSHLNINSPQIILDVSGLSEGLYLLKIDDIGFKKVVIQH